MKCTRGTGEDEHGVKGRWGREKERQGQERGRRGRGKRRRETEKGRRRRGEGKVGTRGKEGGDRRVTARTGEEEAGDGAKRR